MAEPTTRRNEASVSDFIATIENEVRRRDSEAIIRIMREATGAEPKIWGSSIVGFGSYRYRYASGREGDWMLCGFAPRKKTWFSIIIPGFDSSSNLMKNMRKFSKGKSCLYIGKLEDVDTEVLARPIGHSVDQMRARYETEP